MNTYYFFKDYVSLVMEIVEFFTAKAVNQIKYKEISDICLKYAVKEKDSKHETLLRCGLLSINDYLSYVSETKIVNGVRVEQVSVAMPIVETVLRLMSDKFILNSNNFLRNSQTYSVNDELTIYLYKYDFLLNYILGFIYIAEKYRQSVFKVEHIDGQDRPSIGTGFLYSFKKNNENTINSMIITNKHVIEGAKKINLYDVDNKKIGFKGINKSNNMDVAAIILNEPVHFPSFNFGFEFNVLDEIITMGYPSIPMTRDAYQVLHKGEINSKVEDYQGNRLFLFSAKTSSGNSGSPIIDEIGRVIGIVTQELFEEELLLKKGKPPYYAGIPASEIVEFLNEFVSTI